MKATPRGESVRPGLIKTLLEWERAWKSRKKTWRGKRGAGRKTGRKSRGRRKGKRGALGNAEDADPKETKEGMTECRDTQRPKRSFREETVLTVNAAAARVANRKWTGVASGEPEHTATKDTSGVLPQRRDRTVKEEETEDPRPATWDPYLSTKNRRLS